MAIRAPGGGVLRFVHQDIRYPGSLPSANRPTRLAHVNLNATMSTARPRSTSEPRISPDGSTEAMAFVRCNSDHHAIVIADAPVNGLNHVAFLMPDLEAVMRGSGRMIDAGFPIAWGVGRHGPGDNVFAYFIDPVGIVIEYTAEVLQVDDNYVVRGPSAMGLATGPDGSLGDRASKGRSCQGGTAAVPCPMLRRAPIALSRVERWISSLPRNSARAITRSWLPALARQAPSRPACSATRISARWRSTAQRDVYDKPRAIAIDHEILRLLDNLGAADRILPLYRAVSRLAAFRRGRPADPPDRHGSRTLSAWIHANMVFTQPPVEAVLARERRLL